MGRGGLRRDVGRQFLRRAPGQRGQAQQRRLPIGLQLRNGRRLLIAQRVEADLVQPVRPAHPPARR
jgi:putative exporter of polyketide antibiotics